MTPKEKKDARTFCSAGVVLMGLVAASRHFRHHDPKAVYFAAAAAIFLAGALVPVFGRLLFIGAVKLTQPIGWVMTRVILGVFFYGVLTPAGLVMRLFRRDALRLRRPPKETTTWIPKKHPADAKKQMEMQF